MRAFAEAYPDQQFVQQVVAQLPWGHKGAGDFLHRLDTGSHGLIASEIQEQARPCGRGVFPELLKIFFEEIGRDGLEVVGE